jgi:excisionase family DNA binding protein
VDKIFLTFIEAAQFLRLSKPTVERFVAEGKIPSYKVGKRRLFDRDELIEWVKSHRENIPARRRRKSQIVDR